jgi:hypothetical protein
VVPHLGGVVEHRAARGLDQLFERFAHQLLRLGQLVELVDVGTVVLAIVE